MAKNKSNTGPKAASAKEVREQQVNYPRRGVMMVYDQCEPFTITEAARFLAAEFVTVPGVPGPTYHDAQEAPFRYRRDKGLCLVAGSGVGKSVICRAIATANEMGFHTINMAGLEQGDMLGMATSKEDPENPGHFITLHRDPIYEAPVKMGCISEAKAIALDAEIARTRHLFANFEKENLATDHNPYTLKLEQLLRDRKLPLSPPDTLGLCLIDEAMGVDAAQQKQLRQFISQRELNGMQVHDNWIFVFASNPPTSEYFTNRKFDASLEDRFIFLPISEDEDDMIQFFETGHGSDQLTLPPKGIGRPVSVTRGFFHEKLHSFLVMGKINGNSHRRACTRRRWTTISDSLIRQESFGLTEEERLNYLRLALPEEVVTDFVELLSKGPDPKFWPIQGHKLLGATADDHREHMRLIKGWEEDVDNNLLIGATVYLLKAYIRTKTALAEAERRNLKDVLLAVDDDKVANIIEGVSGSLAESVWTLLWNTPKEKMLEDMINRVEGTNANRNIKKPATGFLGKK